MTWRSCIASSRADWTLAGARLISSARIRLLKIGPSLGENFGFLRVVDHGADQVGGQQVGGELEAGEAGVERAGEGLDREGLGQSGHAFEQDVAVAEQADEQAVDQPFLADEDVAHFVFHGLIQPLDGGDPFLQVLR